MQDPSANRSDSGTLSERNRVVARATGVQQIGEYGYSGSMPFHCKMGSCLIFIKNQKVAGCRGDSAYSYRIKDQSVSLTTCTHEMVALIKQNTILASNNTPPASRQISAPRGVTRFWASQKLDICGVWGAET